MAADWAKVKIAYINNSKTLREVAKENGIRAAGVMTRAAKEGWEAERKRAQAETSKAAQGRQKATCPRVTWIFDCLNFFQSFPKERKS